MLILLSKMWSIDCRKQVQDLLSCLDMLLILFIEQEVWMGCTTSCLEVNETCSNIFTLTGQTSLIPDCNAKSPITDSTLQPDQSCNYLNSTGKQNILAQ